MDLDDQLSGRDYFALKRQKHEGENAGAPKQSLVFQGCVIYCNGATVPPQNEIRELVVRNGGGFVFQPSSSVTHVVCTQLSNTKLEKLGPSDHVVSPRWILDCVAHGRRLATTPYELARNTGDGGSSSLLQHFAVPKPVVVTPAAAPVAVASVAAPVAVASVAAPVAVASVAAPVAPAVVVVDPQPPSRGRDCNNPSFLSDYFASSRLHHLSAWRTEFQEQLADELAREAVPPPARGSGDEVIMHVDMDCFFASVAMRHDPKLIGRPLAVCHGEHGEVSACSYEAKARGVKGGMGFARARELCPELICVPYQFALYEQTSRELFRVLRSFTSRLEIVSCDEAYLDVTDTHFPGESQHRTEEARAHALAERIRGAVFEATGCRASIGISFNMLLARMATTKAKPNGQFLISPGDVAAVLAPMSVDKIPGVGYRTQKELAEMGIETCGDLREASKEALESKCGEKKGSKLWLYARGVCGQTIQSVKRRKSIGVDVNSAIRFTETRQVKTFIDRLCAELVKRLKGRRGRQLTLKVMLKRPDWTEPTHHFLGHGRADSKQKSVAMTQSTGDLAVLAGHAKRLYQLFEIRDDTDLVGIGVSLSKLDAVEDEAAPAKGEAMATLFNAKPAMEEVKKDDAPAAADDTAAAAAAARKRVQYVSLDKDEVDRDEFEALLKVIDDPKLRREMRTEYEVLLKKKQRTESARPAQPSASAPRSILSFGAARSKGGAAATAGPSKQAKIARSAPAAAAVAATAAPYRAPARYQSLTSDQVDPDILAELPPELRDAFLEELKEADRRSEAKAIAAGGAVAATAEPVAVVVELEDDDGVKAAFWKRYTNWRGLLPQWLARLDGALNVDECVMHLVAFAKEMIDARNLEDLQRLLRDLQQFIDYEATDEGWLMVWNRALTDIQAQLIEHYGGVLLFELKS